MGAASPPPVALLALVDTGASNSGVREGTFARIGVQPTDSLRIRTVQGVIASAPVYLGRMLFPGGLVIPVSAAELALREGDPDCILGRDILSRGRMEYDGETGSCRLWIRGVEIPVEEPTLPA